MTESNLTPRQQRQLRRQIRYTLDGSICMVYEDGEPLRAPTQEDMDTLPVGPDLTQSESLDLMQD